MNLSQNIVNPAINWSNKLFLILGVLLCVSHEFEIMRTQIGNHSHLTHALHNITGGSSPEINVALALERESKQTTGMGKGPTGILCPQPPVVVNVNKLAR